MNFSKVFIISPSGNFYGSEQVLADYLKHTKKQCAVAVPAGSIFFKQLLQAKLPHQIKEYNVNSIKLFYARLFLKLLSSKYKVIYLTEAGHSKYILLLAKIFSRKKFVIHIRIAEDTVKERWPASIPSNVALVSISKYMQSMFSHKSIQLYDPYDFTVGDEQKNKEALVFKDDKFHIGIIGRISASKGLGILLQLLQSLKENNNSDFVFHLFGEPDSEAKANGNYKKLDAFENIKFHGFVENKKDIYNSINCVMHLAQNEPLGRIFPEAIEHHVPLIGFNAGGIGEIGNITGLTELLVNTDLPDIVGALLRLMYQVKTDNAGYIQKCISAKLLTAAMFSVTRYTDTVDKLLAY